MMAVQPELHLYRNAGYHRPHQARGRIFTYTQQSSHYPWLKVSSKSTPYVNFPWFGIGTTEGSLGLGSGLGFDPALLHLLCPELDGLMFLAIPELTMSSTLAVELNMSAILMEHSGKTTKDDP
jgi:hypothetical protein